MKHWWQWTDTWQWFHVRVGVDDRSTQTSSAWSYGLPRYWWFRRLSTTRQYRWYINYWINYDVTKSIEPGHRWQKLHLSSKIPRHGGSSAKWVALIALCSIGSSGTTLESFIIITTGPVGKVTAVFAWHGWCVLAELDSNSHAKNEQLWHDAEKC